MNALKNFEEDLNPEYLICVFERAFFGACLNIFSNVTVKCCFFHFTRCMYRHIQQLGLQNLYTADLTFNSAVKMLVSIASVPIGDVIYTYETLLETEYLTVMKIC